MLLSRSVGSCARSPEVAYIHTLRFYQRRQAEYAAGVAPRQLVAAADEAEIRDAAAAAFVAGAIAATEVRAGIAADLAAMGPTPVLPPAAAMPPPTVVAPRRAAVAPPPPAVPPPPAAVHPFSGASDSGALGSSATPSDAYIYIYIYISAKCFVFGEGGEGGSGWE